MATATKKRKEEAYPWKAGANSRHTTNLKQSILRLAISMIVAKYELISVYHRFKRITRYNLGFASIGNSLETVGSYTNNS
jgi:hypothetical protein